MQNMTSRRYRSIPDLARQIAAAARDGRTVPLSPETAQLVALALRAFATDPSRDEIAKLLCTVKEGCPATCATCTGRANLIVRLYRGDEGPELPDDPPASSMTRAAKAALRVVRG